MLKRAGIKEKIAVALIISLIAASIGMSGCGRQEQPTSDRVGSVQQELPKETKAPASSKEKEKKEKVESKETSPEQSTIVEEEPVRSQEKEEPKTAPAESKPAKKSSAASTEKKTESCTISISAETLLSSEQASEETRSIIPEQGRILTKQTMNLQKGDTVKSILLRVTKKKGIAVSVSGGNYVQGIAGLFEFDGGAESGWMYRVNGTFPQVACSDYTVKDGDTIQWLYTCANGEDL